MFYEIIVEIASYEYFLIPLLYIQKYFVEKFNCLFVIFFSEKDACRKHQSVDLVDYPL